MDKSLLIGFGIVGAVVLMNKDEALRPSVDFSKKPTQDALQNINNAYGDKFTIALAQGLNNSQTAGELMDKLAKVDDSYTPMYDMNYETTKTVNNDVLVYEAGKLRYINGIDMWGSSIATLNRALKGWEIGGDRYNSIKQMIDYRIKYNMS